jgi:hypothetical protein
MTTWNSRAAAALVLVALAGGGPAAPQETTGTQPPLPPPREITGITAPDPHPRACVDCHVVYPEIDQDERLSTLMTGWSQAVDPKLLATAQAAMPKGVALKGRHPAAPGALKKPPASCLPCHGRTSKTAPPFARMIHAIHLTGGKDNVFLTRFQGECTHCHKLDTASGAWLVPSGPEKEPGP